MNKLYYKFMSKFFWTMDDCILFDSFYGNYSDNPKYISESVHRLYPNIKIIWLVKEYNDEIPDYVKCIKINTKEANYYYCKSKIIVDNTYGFRENYLWKKNILSKIKFKIKTVLNNNSKQKVYTTWHGTPLKKMGIDQLNSKIIDFSCPNTIMILDNKFTKEVMQRLTFNKIDIKIIGAPRNDMLFDDTIDENAIKKKLGIPTNKKVVLFAPSFREKTGIGDLNIEKSGIEQINSMDLDKLFSNLENKFSGDWIIVCRFHYHVERKIDWKKIHDRYGNKVINGNKYQDMTEYLRCSDILITDVSSCMFDFSLTKKPVFLYFPDLKNYESNERGMYFDVYNLPFSCAETFEDLIKNINNFNLKKYENECLSLHHNLGYFFEKKSADVIAKYIVEGKNND